MGEGLEALQVENDVQSTKIETWDSSSALLLLH